jgi:hypothetical protein
VRGANTVVVLPSLRDFGSFYDDVNAAEVSLAISTSPLTLDVKNL